MKAGAELRGIGQDKARQLAWGRTDAVPSKEFFSITRPCGQCVGSGTNRHRTLVLPASRLANALIGERTIAPCTHPLAGIEIRHAPAASRIEPGEQHGVTEARQAIHAWRDCRQAARDLPTPSGTISSVTSGPMFAIAVSTRRVERSVLRSPTLKGTTVIGQILAHINVVALLAASATAADKTPCAS